MSVFVLTLSDVIAICLFGIVLVAAVVSASARFMRQIRCKHERVYETQACDAICVSCGRNLGFIQKWRDRQKETGA